MAVQATKPAGAAPAQSSKPPAKAESAPKEAAPKETAPKPAANNAQNASQKPETKSLSAEAAKANFAPNIDKPKSEPAKPATNAQNAHDGTHAETGAAGGSSQSQTSTSTTTTNNNGQSEKTSNTTTNNNNSQASDNKAAGESSNSQNTPASGATDQAPATTAASDEAKAKAEKNKEKATVFLIDDFLPEEEQKNEQGNAFNHGETMAQIIGTGGTSAAGAGNGAAGSSNTATQENTQNNTQEQTTETKTTTDADGNTVTQTVTTAANGTETVTDESTTPPADGQNPQIEIIKFNVDDPESGKSRMGLIADGLDEAYKLYESGEDIDSVSLSQAAQFEDEETKIINEKIKKLNDAGIPVVVAAGNNGPEVVNPMAPDSAIIVQNAELGKDEVSSASGPGNITGEGKYTSHATANVSPQAAILHNQGLNNDEIKAKLAEEAAAEGGALDTPAGSNDPVYTTPGVSTFSNPIPAPTVTPNPGTDTGTTVAPDVTGTEDPATLPAPVTPEDPATEPAPATPGFSMESLTSLMDMFRQMFGF